MPLVPDPHIPPDQQAANRAGVHRASSAHGLVTAAALHPHMISACSPRPDHLWIRLTDALNGLTVLLTQLSDSGCDSDRPLFHTQCRSDICSCVCIVFGCLDPERTGPPGWRSSLAHTPCMGPRGI